MHRMLMVEICYEYPKWREVASFNADLEPAFHFIPSLLEGEVKIIKGQDFIAWAEDKTSPTWTHDMLSMASITIIAYLRALLAFNIDVRLILLEYPDLPERIL